jgi:hypothetical protein
MDINAPTQPQPVTPVRHRPPAWLVVTFTGLASLLIGIGIGGSGEGAEATTDTSPPATVVTVSDVPDVCLEALNNAEDLMGFSADFADIAAEMPMMIYDGIEAGMAYDATAVEDLTDKLNTITADVEELTEQIGSSDYRDNAAQCRDAAG